MKLCRCFFLSVLLLFCAASLYAKDRVVEKSGKTPDWIMSAGKDRFSVFATGDDLNTARDKCLADIRQYIAGSVATNIVSKEVSVSESRNDNGAESITSTYSSDLTAAAAKLPFLTDISLSNAEGIYWEKLRRSSDKSYYYIYYVLYPFPQHERDRLINEFRKYDREKYDALLALKESYGTLTDVSQLDAGIRDLESLVEYFFDDVRKKEAESLMDTYRSAYGKISLVPETNELGRFSYCLMLDGHRITSSRMPSLRSETAVSMELRPGNDMDYVLTYDHSLCYPTDDNCIYITYSFPGGGFRYEYRFDVSEKDRKVLPVGVIGIVASRQDSSFVADVALNIRSKAGSAFEVHDVEFSISPSLVFHSGDTAAFEGKGTHFLKFREMLAALPEDRERGMLTGTMSVVSEGRTERVTFTLPYKISVE